MFTDIVGYTALTQKAERRALRLLAIHRRLIRSKLALHQGREIKTMGDAFLVEFYSALEALECAVDIQNTIHDNPRLRKERLEVRVGIHVGDVVEKDGDVFGDAVNIASRIEPLAHGGDICISEQVYDQVRNKISYPLAKLESQDLKNVAFPVDVYCVLLPWTKQIQPHAQSKPAVSLVRKYTPTPGKPAERGVWKSRYISKMVLKNKIVDIVLLNSPENASALAKFGGEVDFSRGETLHMVSALETVSVVVDAKNQSKLVSMVAKKDILRVMENLSEVIISFAEEALRVPGVAATITEALAASGVNIIEYITATLNAIVIVESKDAMKCYQSIEALTA